MSQINEKDVFETITKVFDKFHENIERSNPQYLQSLTNLQQEYMTAWKNFIHTSISTQQKYAKKTGIKTDTPEVTSQVVHEITDQMTKVFELQNKIVQTVFDASKQNTRTINENATAFAELNEKILNSWTTIWDSKQ